MREKTPTRALRDPMMNQMPMDAMSALPPVPKAPAKQSPVKTVKPVANKAAMKGKKK